MTIIKEIKKLVKKNKKIIKKNLNLENNLDFKMEDDIMVIYSNGNKILSATYDFFGIIKNDIWMWGTMIPGVNEKFVKVIKEIKDFSHMFENNNDKRMLFYNHLLSENMLYINNNQEIKWINELLIYLNDSLWYINPINNLGNYQIITLNKIIEVYN